MISPAPVQPTTPRRSPASQKPKIAVQTGSMAAVFRWASGDDDWARVVAHSFGGHEGDLIRAMRRLIDLLRQLAESDEVAP